MRSLGAIIAAVALLGGCDRGGTTDHATDVDGDVVASRGEPSAKSAQCLADAPRGDLFLHAPSPDWRKQIIYMVLIDRFMDSDPSNNDFGEGEYLRGSPAHFNGGDIAGLSEKLDYIQGTGATALWVSPPVYNQW